MFDYFFVEKVSYYMVTPTTLLCDSESKTEKLRGRKCCVQVPTEMSEETFYFARGTPEPYETSAARSYVLLRRTPRAPGIYRFLYEIL